MTHDDGRGPSALGHLSDSGDQKTEKWILTKLVNIYLGTMFIFFKEMIKNVENMRRFQKTNIFPKRGRYVIFIKTVPLQGKNVVKTTIQVYVVEDFSILKYSKEHKIHFQIILHNIWFITFSQFNLKLRRADILLHLRHDFFYFKATKPHISDLFDLIVL